MSSRVSFRDVSFRLGQRDIVSRLSLDIEAGGTTVFLGRNGSGKTTALKMINGLLFPTGGEVLVDGQATTRWDPIQLRRRIGYVIQEGGLFPHFTVAENVALIPRLQGWEGEQVRQRVADLLDLFGLPYGQFAARYPRELSGGQRQRVGIARALAAGPTLLLFDEPFDALDLVTRLDLQRKFLAWRRRDGKTSVLVTHDVREALTLGTHIVLLCNGTLELQATPSEFQQSRSEEAQAFLACLNPTHQAT